MVALAGIAVVFVCVFGSYLLGGGKFGVLLEAAPFELVSIGGAAAGTFLIANGTEVVKGALGDIRRVVSGPQWARQDYNDLLSLMYLIVKLLKTRGVLALEPHVDKAQFALVVGIGRAAARSQVLEALGSGARSRVRRQPR